MTRYLLAIDQGTTGSTALVMGVDGETLGRHTCELPQHFPEPAWVEHDPEEILQSVRDAVAGALLAAGVSGNDLRAIGIANQRETTLVWERASGRPVHRAIVWQDRRTSGECQRLRDGGHAVEVRRRTGLVIDPYFSASKIAWILDHTGLREAAGAGALCFGTVDSFLIWSLAGGAAAAAPHVTEISNASRTSLMRLSTGCWDASLCELFRVPLRVLPDIVPSAGSLAVTRGFDPLPDGVPITGVAGDQQAALFGQACFQPGDVKCTYGTGAFVVANTGDYPVESRHGLLSTVAWKIGEATTYALEGSCFVAGAAVQWLRDGLGLIQSSDEVEALARSVPSSEGVVFVPALSGLGAPHWDADARGLITGLTRGSKRGHLARATLEAIGLQVADLISAMREDLGRDAPGTDAPASASGAALSVRRIRVDGGAARNDLLLQYQSDVSDVVIERPRELESTARGAAMLAGVGAGMLGGIAEAATMLSPCRRFQPEMAENERWAHLERWRSAVARARGSGSEVHGR